MKKDVTLVPQDKCPLDILAELESRTKNAWIYLHENAIEKLKKTCDKYEEWAHCISLTWEATDKFPAANIYIGQEEIGCWKPIFLIKAEDIAFSTRVSDPDEIFFIKMDE